MVRRGVEKKRKWPVLESVLCGGTSGGHMGVNCEGWVFCSSIQSGSEGLRIVSVRSRKDDAAVTEKLRIWPDFFHAE